VTGFELVKRRHKSLQWTQLRNTDKRIQKQGLKRITRKVKHHANLCDLFETIACSTFFVRRLDAENIACFHVFNFSIWFFRDLWIFIDFNYHSFQVSSSIKLNKDVVGNTASAYAQYASHEVGFFVLDN
jgi:hypothetical protein